MRSLIKVNPSEPASFTFALHGKLRLTCMTFFFLRVSKMCLHSHSVVSAAHHHRLSTSLTLITSTDMMDSKDIRNLSHDCI